MLALGAAVGAAAAISYAALTGPAAPPANYVPDPPEDLPQYQSGCHGGVSEPKDGKSIPYAAKGIASQRFPTLPLALIEVACDRANEVALRYEAPGYPADRAGEWREITWGQYHDKVVRFAKSLLALDPQPFSGVAICGFNAPEWFIAHLGAAFSGCLSAGTYTTSSPDTCAFVAAHSKSVVAVCDTIANAAKYLKIREKIPTVKQIIVWGEPIPVELRNDLLSFTEFLELGKNIPDDRIQRIVQDQQPQHAVALIYTVALPATLKA